MHLLLLEDSDDLTLQKRITQDSSDGTQAVNLELEAWLMSMHDIYMIHDAKASTSGIRRTGEALLYMSSTSHFDRAIKPVDGKPRILVSFDTNLLWLIKVVDACGKNDVQIRY